MGMLKYEIKKGGHRTNLREAKANKDKGPVNLKIADSAKMVIFFYGSNTVNCIPGQKFIGYHGSCMTILCNLIVSYYMFNEKHASH